MPARIIGGNLRDLSYIASNLRPDDFAEVDCQFESWTPALLALTALQGPAYVVELDGNPEAAFGAAEQRTGLWTVWSWGTKRMWRCVPRITSFVKEVMLPDAIAKGALRGEARALASNEMAQRWLMHLGATRRCELPYYGKNGETFVLWDWTLEQFDVHREPVQKAGRAKAAAIADSTDA